MFKLCEPVGSDIAFHEGRLAVWVAKVTLFANEDMIGELGALVVISAVLALNRAFAVVLPNVSDRLGRLLRLNTPV